MSSDSLIASGNTTSTSVQKVLTAQSADRAEQQRLERSKTPLTAAERRARNAAIEKKLVEQEHRQRFAAKRKVKTRQHLEKEEREKAKVKAQAAHVIKDKKKKKKLRTNRETSEDAATGKGKKVAGSHLTNLMLKTLEKRRIR